MGAQTYFHGCFRAIPRRLLNDPVRDLPFPRDAAGDGQDAGTENDAPPARKRYCG